MRIHSAKKAEIAENLSSPQEILLTPDAFWNFLGLMIMNKLSFLTVDFTAQMQYFMMRVANFEPS